MNDQITQANPERVYTPAQIKEAEDEVGKCRQEYENAPAQHRRAALSRYRDSVSILRQMTKHVGSWFIS